MSDYRGFRIEVDTRESFGRVLMDVAIGAARRGEHVLFFTGAANQEQQTFLWDEMAELVGLAMDSDVVFGRPGCQMRWPLSGGHIRFARRDDARYRGYRASVCVELGDRCQTSEAVHAHTRIYGRY